MKSLYTLLFLLLMMTSCEKSLDIIPTDQLSDATVFNDPQTANLFLNDIYNSLNAGPYTNHRLNLPSEIGADPLDNLTDNTCYGPTNSTLPSGGLFDPGTYGPSNDLFKPHWGKMYEFIRKCNLFIEKTTKADFDDTTKKSLIAQARFARAYFYKSLVDVFRGVPIITAVLDRNSGDDIYYTRNTYEECLEFIRTECDGAAADLPLKVTGKDLGHATKGAALALKNELELYAGKWSDVINSYQAIKELGIYNLFPDYGDLFYEQNENNEEVIFDIQFAANIRPKHINQYWGVVEERTANGWGSSSPTQNIVDEYEYADGKTAAEGSSLYDPEHPYENRTRRFYASVIYDGSIWRGKTIYTRLGIPNNASEINVVGRAGNAGRTGYYLRKLQDSTIQSTPSNLDGTNVIIYRYAEILLNYAEAQNELSGPDQDVYDAVNRVRVRAGLPELPIGLNQDQMRERIRRERRVELAFEGKRFFDILRWRVADEIFSKPIYGMKITEVNGKLVYERVEIRKVKFDPSKNYLMPIPQEVIDKNPKIEQNPNY